MAIYTPPQNSNDVVAREATWKVMDQQVLHIHAMWFISTFPNADRDLDQLQSIAETHLFVERSFKIKLPSRDDVSEPDEALEKLSSNALTWETSEDRGFKRKKRTKRDVSGELRRAAGQSSRASRR